MPDLPDMPAASHDAADDVPTDASTIPTDDAADAADEPPSLSLPTGAGVEKAGAPATIAAMWDAVRGDVLALVERRARFDAGAGGGVSRDALVAHASALDAVGIDGMGPILDALRGADGADASVLPEDLQTALAAADAAAAGLVAITTEAVAVGEALDHLRTAFVGAELVTAKPMPAALVAAVDAADAALVKVRTTRPGKARAPRSTGGDAGARYAWRRDSSDAWRTGRSGIGSTRADVGNSLVKYTGTRGGDVLAALAVGEVATLTGPDGSVEVRRES